MGKLALANTYWQAVGSNRGYISTGAGYETDIAVSDSGVVYTAFEDKKNGKKARIRKLDGTNWTDLTDANNPAGLISTSRGRNPVITTKGSEAYIAFSDQANGKKVRVKKWDGSNWADLSDANYPNGLISLQEGEEPEIAFDKAQDTLYVAFADEANGYRTKVMSWNGSVWSAVADSNNPEGFISVGAGEEVAIAPSKLSNSMYFVYEDISSGLKLRVKKWDGSNWSDVTDSAHPDGLITDTASYSPSLAVDSQDNVYIVYTYKKEGNTHIIYWNSSVWNVLGSGTVVKGKSIESTVAIDDSDNIIVAMSQYKKIGKQKKSFRVRVRKWNGLEWINVSDNNNRQGFLSKKGKGDPSLATGDGKVYIIFTDYSSRRRARVMYFNPADVQ
jgi:hypothetical protein